MNAFEINKIIGAVLGALVFVMGLSVLSDLIFDEHPLDELAYGVDAPPETSAENEADESAPEEAFAVLLASADPVAGENSTAVCAACHSFDDGGPNGIGPAIYNVVGREIAGVADFGYSSALVTHGEGKTWTYEELDGFLENPQGWVPGTSMSYAGVKDAKERANLVAYLRSISPDAPPLPEVPEATEEAAIEGGETETAAVANEAAPDDAAPATTESDAAASDGTTDTASTDAAATEGDAAATDSGTDAFTQLVASSDPSTGEANAAVCMAC
ncbi:MAG: c-type cytochrome, partial [Pseudomonadota bacterium]